MMLKIVYFVSSAERPILTQERVATRAESRRRFTCGYFISPILKNFTALVRENQLSERRTTPTRLTFGVRRTKNHFIHLKYAKKVISQNQINLYLT